MAIKKIEHTGIMVKSIEQSVAFYTNGLGLELKGTLDHNVPGLKLAFLGFPNDDSTLIELVEGHNKPNLAAEGLVHHIAFTVDDVEQEAQRLSDLNVKFIEEEITTLRDGSRYIFFEGPDGEQLELFQPRKSE